MNCKPRELAVVIGVPDSEIPEVRDFFNGYLGRIVRVIEVVRGDAWAIEKPIVRFGPNGETIVAGVIEDQYLQPIRGLRAHDELRHEVAA